MPELRCVDEAGLLAGRRAHAHGELRCQAARVSDRDAGVTLIEVMVSMAVVSIVMAVSITAMITVFRSGHRSEAVAISRSQLNVAVAKLGQLRYAAGISVPGNLNGDRFVEFIVAGAVTTCTELRLGAADQQLRQRTWNYGATPVAGAWTLLASEVTASEPFIRYSTDGDHPHQRLEVHLVATTSYTDSTWRNPQVDDTFTAVNTSPDTSSDTVCALGRGVL